MRLEIRIVTETLMDAAVIEEAINALDLKRVSMEISHQQGEPAKPRRSYTRKRGMMSKQSTLRLTGIKPGDLGGHQHRAWEALIKHWGPDRKRVCVRDHLLDILVKEVPGAKRNTLSAVLSIFTYEHKLLEIVDL